jgi:HPt (histidine-containing phosphotransfer) domain-containing protein
MIDRQRFNDNFQYFDKEIIIEIIDIFFSEHDERFTKLERNVLDRDFHQLKFNAHSLKGVIANFMDPVTIDLSRRLDEASKSKDETGLDQLFDDLKKSTGKLMVELQQIKQELTS